MGAARSAVQVGDQFVLNVLGQNQSRPVMKHFLKRFPPGADRFEGVDVQTSANGSPVLEAGIAHLECKVRPLCTARLSLCSIVLVLCSAVAVSCCCCAPFALHTTRVQRTQASFDSRDARTTR